MSKTKHPRGIARKYARHVRKNREWGQDSVWRPAERPSVESGERRSPRRRIRG